MGRQNIFTYLSGVDKDLIVKFIENLKKSESVLTL